MSGEIEEIRMPGRLLLFVCAVLGKMQRTIKNVTPQDAKTVT